jgi:DNA-binding CsgD family transcriptional regulator
MLPALVLLTDANGRILHANGPARAVLGPCVERQCCELLQTDCMTAAPSVRGYQEVGNVTTNGIVGHVARSEMGDQFVLVVQPRAVAAHDLQPLTPREREVLQWVSRGLTDVAVAERIGLQPSTVRSHMESVRRKLKVRSRSQAIARATAAGIL